MAYIAPRSPQLLTPTLERLMGSPVPAWVYLFKYLI